MPSGNEDGANVNWIPGGKTPAAARILCVAIVISYLLYYK